MWDFNFLAIHSQCTLVCVYFPVISLVLNAFLYIMHYFQCIPQVVEQNHAVPLGIPTNSVLETWEDHKITERSCVLAAKCYMLPVNSSKTLLL